MSVGPAAGCWIHSWKRPLVVATSCHVLAFITTVIKSSWLSLQGMVACIFKGGVPNRVGSLSIGKVTSFLFLRGGGVGHRVIMGCGTFFKAS